MKPLGHKSYGSIPYICHTHESWCGVKSPTKVISPGQASILTERKRDKHDKIYVQEKLDGSNVSVALIDGILYPLVRSGYCADTSPYLQHHIFNDWVLKNREKFYAVLKQNQRICGEWMLLAHGTRYDIRQPEWDLFRPFDIMVGTDRMLYDNFLKQLEGMFRPATLLHWGSSIPIEMSMQRLDVAGSLTQPPDKPEGVVYRVERLGRVDFLAKFVRAEHVAGKYFWKDTWNYDPGLI